MKQAVKNSEAQCVTLQNALETLLARCSDAERVGDGYRRQLAACELQLTQVRERHRLFEAPEDALEALEKEEEVAAWEQSLREETQRVFQKLCERRVRLRVKALVFQDAALCKICFARSASCALMPCRHHAFCAPCAGRVRSSNDPVCPLCRTQ